MNPYLSCYNDLLPVIAKNGAEVRELMPSLPHGNRLQSLAEATLYGGQRTQLHRHLKTEELYHVTAGQGTMVLGEQRFPITVGDTVVVPVGTPHALHNTWPVPLRVLCCCTPAYTAEDMELLEEAEH
jgi:mannose-6-phosphate isomerase-like protein (cupin superfamily)